jgi:hypothetical protein
MNCEEGSASEGDLSNRHESRAERGEARVRPTCNVSASWSREEDSVGVTGDDEAVPFACLSFLLFFLSSFFFKIFLFREQAGKKRSWTMGPVLCVGSACQK